MNKKRLLYLDFIRAIATILIVMVHYNVLYLLLPTPAPEKAFIGTYFFRVYLGDLGSTLFFIISGAALMRVYEEECDLKLFYKKRFLSIFPMFWIAFIIDFLIRVYLNGGINPTIPKWRFILSAIGMDSYLEDVIPSFYCVGGMVFRVHYSNLYSFSVIEISGEKISCGSHPYVWHIIWSSRNFQKWGGVSARKKPIYPPAQICVWNVLCESG